MLTLKLLDPIPVNYNHSNTFCITTTIIREDDSRETLKTYKKNDMYACFLYRLLLAHKEQTEYNNYIFEELKLLYYNDDDNITMHDVVRDVWPWNSTLENIEVTYFDQHSVEYNVKLESSLNDELIRFKHIWLINDILCCPKCQSLDVSLFADNDISYINQEWFTLSCQKCKLYEMSDEDESINDFMKRIYNNEDDN